MTDEAAIVAEWLDMVANDSDNLERVMKNITDDCVFVIEPGGTEYHGFEEIRAFVTIAMAGRTHDKEDKIKITNWFSNGENLCYEYTRMA